MNNIPGRKPYHSILSLDKKGNLGENKKIDFGRK